MEIEKILNKMKNNENSDSIGMIASHLGIVRSFSRNGKDVEGVDVKYNMDKLGDIIVEEGIVEIYEDGGDHVGSFS